MEKAVIYARYSSDKQTEQSIEGQVRCCEEFAKAKGYTIIGEYIDRGLSGKIDTRPEFQRMIKDSHKRCFQFIIVYQLDRFSRDKYDSAIHKNTLRKNGVRVLSSKENITDDPSGMLMETVLEGMAEYYVAELAIKIKRGMNESWLKGHYLGGLVTYGYNKVSIDPAKPKTKRYEINKAEAEIVRQIFAQYSNGKTIKQIQKWLGANKVVNKKGQPFPKNTLLNMLANKKYIGTLTLNGQENKNGIPAIVDKKLFADVQKRLFKNQGKPSAHKAPLYYLLSGTLYCGYCHLAVTGDSGTSGTKGVVYRYYKCVKKKARSQPCECRQVNKKYLEDLIVKATIEHALTDEQIAFVVNGLIEKNKQLERNIKLERFEHQLKECQSSINSIVDVVCKGLSSKALQEKLLLLESEKADLEWRIEGERLNTPIPLDADELTFWLEQFREINAEDEKSRQFLVDTFVNKIILFNDKVIITFNVKGRDNKKLTISEILSDIEPELNRFGLDQFGAPTCAGIELFH